MRWEIGMGLGFNYLHEYNFLGNGGAIEDRPESGGIFAVRVLGWVLDNVGLEIEGKLLPTSYRNGRGGSATVIGARAQVLYSFLPLAEIRPFISAGGGMEIFNAANSKAALEKTATYSLESDRDWTTLLGAGVQWQFMHRLGLRFDGRWAPSAGKTAALSKLKTAESAMAHNVEATVALQYTLGGKPGDSDLDGILDGKDRCEDQAEDKDGFQDEDGCPELDNDGDGIPDKDDQGGDNFDRCPNEPEDKDGYKDYDGCPELDNDEDGVNDGADKCPTQKEDKDGFQDDDGCPDPDNDGDGNPDGKDKCPLQKEDVDGFQDDDGCPDLDNDADGIPDAKDKCPNAAETKNGFEDEDGCADENPDLDKDGVPDSSDKCPDKPETKNGFEDSDGCPDVVPAALKKFAGAIKGIEFEVGSAKIVAKSFPVLDGAVKVLKEFADTKIEVSGHTDNTGDAEANKKLSQERAESVKAYLVEKGVAAERVTTVGFGPDKPVADNKNKAGQAKNRRIEFKLL
jgi:outer membrane protein OmpA-like peptidoglycan-associated protein